MRCQPVQHFDVIDTNPTIGIQKAFDNPSCRTEILHRINADKRKENIEQNYTVYRRKDIPKVIFGTGQKKAGKIIFKCMKSPPVN